MFYAFVKERVGYDYCLIMFSRLDPKGVFFRTEAFSVDISPEFGLVKMLYLSSVLVN